MQPQQPTPTPTTLSPVDAASPAPTPAPPAPAEARALPALHAPAEARPLPSEAEAERILQEKAAQARRDTCEAAVTDRRMKPDFGDVAELQRRLAAAADAQAEARAARAGELSRRQREQEQSRRRQDLAAALRDASGLRGTIYDDASLDSLEHPRRRLTPAQFEQYVAARDDVRSLLREPGILVLSSRDPGPGKTYLGAALVNAFCDAGRPARFLDMHQFYIELFSTFGAPGRTREDFYERMYGYDLLVLDEIERRPKTEFRNEEFFHLVNQRQIRRGKSTVLTTNLTLAQLNGADESGPFLPPAVRDRIGHTGGTVIVFDWPTLRGEPRPRVNGNGRAA